MKLSWEGSHLRVFPENQSVLAPEVTVSTLILRLFAEGPKGQPNVVTALSALRGPWRLWDGHLGP